MPDEVPTRTCPACGGVMEFNPNACLGYQGTASSKSGPELVYGPGWECQNDGCGEVAPAAV